MTPLIQQLINKNANLQYHLLVIIVFSFIYYNIAQNNSEDDENYLQFRDYGSCLYYTIITHFTIGYGDISPRTDIMKVMCCIQIILAFTLTQL